MGQRESVLPAIPACRQFNRWRHALACRLVTFRKPQIHIFGYRLKPNRWHIHIRQSNDVGECQHTGSSRLHFEWLLRALSSCAVSPRSGGPRRQEKELSGAIDRRETQINEKKKDLERFVHYVYCL